MTTQGNPTYADTRVPNRNSSGASEQLAWSWQGETLALGFDRSGEGPSVLLLPALSSISTRREMRPLQERLSARFHSLAVDWPGFGDEPRPPLDWTPDAYSAFLSFVLKSVVPRPHAIIAAGHAGTYVLKHLAAQPGSAALLILIAPTWRGPLPTMMGGQRPFFDRLCRLVDHPVIGPLIYRLNVNRPVVRRMGAGHVYSNARFLDAERLAEKLEVVRAPGARSSSIRFVTGRLDPASSRDEFLDYARRAGVPILVTYGAETPSRSRAEIEALANVAGVKSIVLRRGKLSIHEEFPNATFEAIAPFLSEGVHAQ
jgi:pimeloyl-ACP methyl ester carboxylesterase